MSVSISVLRSDSPPPVWQAHRLPESLPSSSRTPPAWQVVLPLPRILPEAPGSAHPAVGLQRLVKPSKSDSPAVLPRTAVPVGQGNLKRCLQICGRLRSQQLLKGWIPFPAVPYAAYLSENLLLLGKISIHLCVREKMQICVASVRLEKYRPPVERITLLSAYDRSLADKLFIVP